MRQAPILREYDPPPGVAIASLEHDYAAGFVVPEHAHGSGQLIYAVRGVIEVTSRPSVWVIPPQFALWVPARTPHSIFIAPGSLDANLVLQAPLFRRKQEPEHGTHPARPAWLVVRGIGDALEMQCLSGDPAIGLEAARQVLRILQCAATLVLAHVEP